MASGGPESREEALLRTQPQLMCTLLTKKARSTATATATATALAWRALSTASGSKTMGRNPLLWYYGLLDLLGRLCSHPSRNPPPRPLSKARQADYLSFLLRCRRMSPVASEDLTPPSPMY